MTPSGPKQTVQVIDRVAGAFELAWKVDALPALAEYAARLPVVAHREGLIERIQRDIEYRRQRGQSKSLHDDVPDFPLLMPIGRRLRSQVGDGP